MRLLTPAESNSSSINDLDDRSNNEEMRLENFNGNYDGGG